MLCHDIAHDHRQKRHKNAVDEVDGLEIPHEAHAAGDACANEEDHKAEFPERFQDLLARHKIGPANVAEVTEYQRDEQCAACCGEREEVEELHRAKQNAKHGGDGKRIDASIAQEGGFVVICIRDYGPGIPEEELPRVKMKFYKGSSKARGSGIGLAVCEEIVTMHGGSLTLENAAGGGTLVTISIPAGEE